MPHKCFPRIIFRAHDRPHGRAMRVSWVQFTAYDTMGRMRVSSGSHEVSSVARDRLMSDSRYVNARGVSCPGRLELTRRSVDGQNMPTRHVGHDRPKSRREHGTVWCGHRLVLCILSINSDFLDQEPPSE